MIPLRDPTDAKLRPLANLIFASRWPQLPLYKRVDVFRSWVEKTLLWQTAIHLAVDQAAACSDSTHAFSFVRRPRARRSH